MCDCLKEFSRMYYQQLSIITMNVTDTDFRMAFSDFAKHFQKLEICHLGPSELDPGTKKWEATQQEGSWKKRICAGGCRNYLGKYSRDIQYLAEMVDADDDGDKAGMFI